MSESRIVDSRNPEYDETALSKYRLVYDGGQDFIEIALKRYSHERADVWQTRRDLAYNPAFAEEAINEYVHALLQYQHDVVRVGGDETYLACCRGEKRGVDGLGTSMDSFIGQKVISELLVMGTVGVYVDTPVQKQRTQNGNTLLDKNATPYIYAYAAEDILNWSYDENKQLQAILLRDHIESIDPVTGLPDAIVEQYRHLRLINGKCHVNIFDSEGSLISFRLLNLDKIPFVQIKIQQSLLKNVCDYQMALTNLSSSTFFYAWGANFPFYVEQYDPMFDRRYFEDRQNDLPPDPDGTTDPQSDDYNDSQTPTARRPDKDQISVGALSGRRYGKGLNPPSFINPSTLPMTASMEKERQLKEEIRQLVALNISTLSSKMASAESKARDREGLEGGLTFIGLTLESGEQQIADLWHAYINKAENSSKIRYPEKYTLISDEDRRAESKELKELQHAVPSRVFQKQVCKKIVQTMFGNTATPNELQSMYNEIDTSSVPTADPEIIRSDHEAGFVSTKTASVGRGYQPSEAERAKQDHADRLARIKAAQSEVSQVPVNADARGLEDEAINQGDDAKNEKTKSQDGNLDKSGRGKAAKISE